MLETELIRAETAEPEPGWLMIVLHGLGDSMDGFRWLPSAMRLPWMNYLLVNAPDTYYGGYSWYDFATDPGPGVDRSRALLETLLKQQEQANWRSDRTFLFGFSQGCLMTLETGLRYPQVFAGLIGISGYVHDAPGLIRDLIPTAKKQRVLFTHGTMDPLIPIEPVRRQTQQLIAAGVDLEWLEFDKEHTIAGEAELSVIRRFVEKAHAGPRPDQDA